MADLNQAVQLDPNFQDALKNRIRLYYATNRQSLLIPEIDKYLTKFPGDAEIIQIRSNLLGK